MADLEGDLLYLFCTQGWSDADVCAMPWSRRKRLITAHHEWTLAQSKKKPNAG